MVNLHPLTPHIMLSYTHNKHTHPFNGPLSRTTRLSRYQRGKTNQDFTEARDSEWQWHQLGHMQVCTSLQTDNRASTPPLSFLQAGCPSCRPTYSVKALKAQYGDHIMTTDSVTSIHAMYRIVWYRLYKLLCAVSLRACVTSRRQISTVKLTLSFARWLLPLLLCVVLFIFECIFYLILFYLQCFDTVGWAAGRASGL